MDQDVLQTLAEETAQVMAEETQAAEAVIDAAAAVAEQTEQAAEALENAAEALAEAVQEQEELSEEQKALLQQKREIARQAEFVARKNRTQAGAQELEQLQAQWDAIPAVESEKEQELAQKLASAKEEYARRQADRDSAAQKKHDLIVDAKLLAKSDEFKKTGEQFKALMEQWKAAGSAGTDRDDALWEEFNGARQSFYDRRSAHFEEMDAKRAKAREVKAQIIEEAKAVSENPANWKQAGDQMNALFEQWKAAGSAGRDYDDELWQQYTQIRNVFRARRQAFYNEMDAKRAHTAEVKAQIIAQAQELVETGDNSAETAKKMKELDAQWKAAGSAGRDHDDDLWHQYRAVTDSFWSFRKAAYEQRHSEWQAKQDDWKARMNTALARKQKQIADLQDQIRKLKERTGGSFDVERIERYQGYINEKEDTIRDLKKDIQDIRAKLEASDNR